MAGPVDTRSELTRQYRFDQATPGDDEGLRKLLRTTPFGTDIRITTEREPHYFAANKLMGTIHETLVARDIHSGEIIASGSCSVRKIHLGGSIVDAGYLGELRVTGSHRGNFILLRKGYEAFRNMSCVRSTPFFLSSIASDNLPARRFLEKGIKGMPVYLPIDTLHTLVISTNSHKSRRTDLCRPTTCDSRNEINEFLQRNYRRFSWAPYWTEAEFGSEERTPGLRVEDFLVSRRDDGKINGCMAIWNQQQIRQIVVRSYARKIALFRPILNMFSRFRGGIRLPATGRPWSYAFISPMAIDGDDPDVFAGLLESTMQRARIAGYDYLLLGLSEKHPLLSVARETSRCRQEYSSQLYVVYWEKPYGNTFMHPDAIAHPEIALL